MSTAESTALTRADEIARESSALSTNAEMFKTATRMATALAQSTVVPTQYQGNIANVMVAMEYAHRIGASVLAVMQNLDVIHGRPSLRATFLIGTVNASNRFTPIRWKFQGTEGADDWGCRAVAMDKTSGEECIGPLITIALAKQEGWYGKSGSKWKTIPELMLMYRSAAWWSRLYCPELSLGLHTTDEIEDLGLNGNGRSEAAQSLNETLGLTPPAPEPPQYASHLHADVVEAAERIQPHGADASDEQRNRIRELAVKYFEDGGPHRELLLARADDAELGKGQAGMLVGKLKLIGAQGDAD